MVHDYKRFASSYSALEIENTYFLAFRDIPVLVQKYCRGKIALDHGCGAGKSARFLKTLGFEVVGVDINEDMIRQAILSDTSGTYKIIEESRLPFEDSSFDLVFQSSVVEELSSKSMLQGVLAEIARVLKDSGIVVLVRGRIYDSEGEWSSFIVRTPHDFASGDQVELIIRGTEISFPDFAWSPADFENACNLAGLRIVELHQPLATGQEPFNWYQELRKPFWDIYVLRKEPKRT